MIFINGQAKRNLQEQVGYNSEQIDKIFELLDGLNVQDNLIKLTSSSGTLTAEEMAVVERDVAFIIYNYNVYIKASTSATEYIFKQVALSASDQGTYNILQSFRIVITRASGAYTYSSNTVLSLYNKAEMDSLLGAKADTSALTAGLALKANLAGANFTGAITAPSIIENMSGYIWQIGDSNFNLVYVSCVKTGNKVTFVIFGSLTYSSGNSTTIGYFVVPDDVFNKLYPYSVGALTNVLSQITVGFFDDDSINNAGVPIVCDFGKTASRISVNVRGLSQLTASKNYIFRIEQTFLLSDNLAS